MALTPGQVYGLARDAGLGVPEAVIATAIAGAESGYNPGTLGDVSRAGERTPNGQHWGPSVGLWQIRSIQEQRGTGRPRDETKLTDPAFNARSMASISGGGRNFRPWSTFTNGKFKDYMGPAAGAASGTIGLGPLGTYNATDVANGTVGAAASAVSKLNPFAGWQDSALSIALKITATGTALALFVVGARRAVTTS